MTSVEITGVATAAPPLPRELQVEVTAACNLRCHMCLVRYRPPVNRVTGSMDLELFRQLLEENPNLERVTLQGLGEPLLAPGLDEMVALCGARGIEVGFNTNATLLSRRRARRLIEAGLTWLHVSVDGACASTYEAIRDGANYDKVTRNLRGLLDVRAEMARTTPEVQLVFVAMRQNLDDLPLLIEQAAAWGVDKVWVQNLSHDFDDTDPSGDYAPIRAFAEREALWRDGDDRWATSVFAAARAVAARRGVALRLPGLEERPRQRRPGEPGCDWPWRSGYVTHDGTAQPCCMVMGADRADMGDVTAHGFGPVWRGEDFRRFRERLMTDDDPPEVCRGCSMYRGLF